jgi:putative transposase
MCWLGQVSRAGFYRARAQAEPDRDEMDLRDAIQRIALVHRHYGYRRITAELRRQGRVVNHKRVARLMRLDNLLAVRRRAFRPPTSDSRHGFRVYLNLAARLTLSGPNQLWIADITYIRLEREFVYLAAVLDAWSRKVIGWRLSRSLQSTLAVEALHQAVATRQPPRGLVHHSDRGIQYAASEYIALLDRHGILPSMSRAGNPYDNATCESFMKTLKSEEIDGGSYATLEELEKRIGEFLEVYYNRQRLHSSLGYRPPEEFEQLPPSDTPPAAALEFFEA